jgi:hypothetical protein
MPDEVGPGAESIATVYPQWWGSTVTVELVTVTDGSVTLPVESVELFPHGIATLGITIGEEIWLPALIPWSQVVHLNKAS